MFSNCQSSGVTLLWLCSVEFKRAILCFIKGFTFPDLLEESGCFEWLKYLVRARQSLEIFCRQDI